MARAINKLTPKTVAALRTTGNYSDGGGLYLQVSKYGTKNWIFRFTLHGRKREMGLGPLNTITLAEARQAALEYRKLLREGIDPIEDRKASKQEARLSAHRTMTFDECTAAFLKAKQKEWKNPKHRQQWDNTLATYASPVIGKLPVAEVDTGLVLRVLEPLWEEKTETASRLRGRIESVLSWATTRNYRRGENPARWRGHLETLLAKPSKIKNTVHHAALPYKDVPGFVRELRGHPGISAYALEFAILTATRSGEVLGATWEEVDLDEGVWTIPAHRMKARREHRLPLSDAALAVLDKMQGTILSDYVFPGTKEAKPLSNMAMLMVLRRMGRGDLTTHGFRSTFRDWASETTAYPHEVCEMALAHTISNKAEAAYRRGDLFEKRRRLMQDWADYCATDATTAAVVPIRKGVEYGQR